MSFHINMQFLNNLFINCLIDYTNVPDNTVHRIYICFCILLTNDLSFFF